MGCIIATNSYNCCLVTLNAFDDNASTIDNSIPKTHHIVYVQEWMKCIWWWTLIMMVISIGTQQ